MCLTTQGSHNSIPRVASKKPKHPVVLDEIRKPNYLTISDKRLNQRCINLLRWRRNLWPCKNVQVANKMLKRPLIFRLVVYNLCRGYLGGC